MVVVSGFALPLILAHAQIIHPAACIMSIIGGGYVTSRLLPRIGNLTDYTSSSLVYGTILAYTATFSQETEDF